MIGAIGRFAPLRGARRAQTRAIASFSDTFTSCTSADRKPTSLTRVMHELWRAQYNHGDCLVDATVGNGKDTLELARIAGPLDLDPSSIAPCRVHGFDIQSDAVEQARGLLRRELGEDEVAGIELYTCCHSELSDVLDRSGVARGSVGNCVFNLGYLPGPDTDKSTVTSASSTLDCLDQAATRWLRSEGIVSLLCYVGHPG